MHTYTVVEIAYSWGRLQLASWPWSCGSWIYNYLCNQCLSPLMLWVWISIRAKCTTLCDKVCQWLAKGRWFSQGPLVSSTNKTDWHYITEILLKMALNTIKQTNIFGCWNFIICVVAKIFLHVTDPSLNIVNNILYIFCKYLFQKEYRFYLFYVFVSMKWNLNCYI